MVFKEGYGSSFSSARWKVCFDEEKALYTAELYFCGSGGAAYYLYEITKEIFDTVGTFGNDERKSEDLIHTGLSCIMR